MNHEDGLEVLLTRELHHHDVRSDQVQCEVREATAGAWAKRPGGEEWLSSLSRVFALPEGLRRGGRGGEGKRKVVERRKGRKEKPIQVV